MSKYKLSLGAFLGEFALLLLTIVDIRRGFLFPLSDYVKVGFPTAILHFHPYHIPLLLLSIIGSFLLYRYMAALEGNLKDEGIDLKPQVKFIGLILLSFLIVDLFIYRGVPASRITASGKIGIGEAIPLTIFKGWLRPLGEGINYLLLVWHATLLGLLLGGLFITLIAGFIRPWFGKGGFGSHLAGMALALFQPFCSCCAAPIGYTLYRGGVPLGSTLAFIVSAPMLNVTTLFLAITILPPKLAITRIIGGLIVGIMLPYGVNLLSSKWKWEEEIEIRPNSLTRSLSNILDRFTHLFRLERFLDIKAGESPATFISSSFGMTWRLVRLIVPIFLLGTIVTSAIVMILPTPKNDITGIIVASAFGTMLMIPTWTEIPIALGLANAGLIAPAATMLIALPAVSIPCLAIIGGGVKSFKVPLILGFLVFVTGIVAGIFFL